MADRSSTRQLDPTIQLAIELGSLSDPGATIVGSFADPVHGYPSDVDSFEFVKEPRGLPVGTTAAQNYAARFGNVIRQLILYGQQGDSIFFLDFKAGFDPRWPPEAILSSRSVKTQHDIMAWVSSYARQLLPKGFKPDSKPAKFSEQIRKLFTLRWTAAEVVRGYKLIGRQRYSLADAIAQGQTVKLDMAVWAESQARFVAIEIPYVLQPYVKLPDYLTALKNDIRKFSTSATYKPLKVLKRARLVALVTGNKKLAAALAPVFSSPVAALNQVLADVETLSALLEQPRELSAKDKRRVVMMALGFQRRLSAFLGVGVIDHWFNEFPESLPKLAKWLSSLAEALDPIVTDAANDAFANFRSRISALV